jgi:enoyl-[acyl-carrier protein] reductase I
MGFLAGKRLLITGVLSNRSIAYGIARACIEKAPSWRSATWASVSGTAPSSSARSSVPTWSSTATSATTHRSSACSHSSGQHWDQFDGFVHAIAFAPREAIAGDFLDGLSRESFRIAHEISAYSFPAWPRPRCPGCAPAPRC